MHNKCINPELQQSTLQKALLYCVSKGHNPNPSHIFLCSLVYVVASSETRLNSRWSFIIELDSGGVFLRCMCTYVYLCTVSLLYIAHIKILARNYI